MAFTGESCRLFLDDCDQVFSQEELLRFVVGKDANGCPAIKVVVVEEQLTSDYVQHATMAGLKTAINDWITANPTKSIVQQSTFWDGTNHIFNFLYK
jgi:hypothetical protein